MSRYAKAVVAVLTAALTVLASAVTDDRITKAEWVDIALAGLGAAGVFAVPNRPPAGQPSDPRVSEQGYGAVELLVAVLLVVLLVLLILRIA